MKVPDNVRLRFDDYGIIYLSRTPRDAVEYMDTHYTRIPEQMAWRPKCVFSRSRRPSELAPHFGHHAFVIGKGKSADKLAAKHFPTSDPIIGLNEAFMFMEKLGLPNKIFGIRQDTASGVRMPVTTATMLIPECLLPIYAQYPETYIFSLKRDFGITHSCATVIVAIGFARAMGCTTLTMYGFDAYTVRSVEYGAMANCRNIEKDNYPILTQKEQLKFVNTEGLKIRWVTPDLGSYITVL